jgi:hypothetical protein
MLVELRVRIEYNFQKIKEMMVMDHSTLAGIVRTDFSALKLPHPRNDNILPPNSDGLVATWETEVHSVRNKFHFRHDNVINSRYLAIIRAGNEVCERTRNGPSHPSC